MNSIWIARDKDGGLFIFTKRPSRFEEMWNNKSKDGVSEYLRIPDEWFPEVQWSDKEPRELILK